VSTLAVRRGYFAIACLACATILYQVAATRVLSVVLWYHFAFLSVSLAMLGLGAPGVWFALRRPGPHALTRALRAASVAVPLSIVLIFGLGGDLARGEGTVEGIGSMFPPGVLLIIASILVATLSLGSAVCLLLLSAEGRSFGRMYGADLIGATVGALLVVPLMLLVPTPLLVAGCGFLPLAASLALGRGRALVTLGLAAALLAALVWNRPFELRYAKSYVEGQSSILYEKWTPTARLTIWNQPSYGSRAWGWGFGEGYQPTRLRQYWLEQDGSAGTPITELTGSPRDLPHLFHDVTAFGYELRPPGAVCVIGAGGGRDVLTALAAGARSVDAVELNGGIVDALSGPFREFSGNVYHLPGVNAVVSEGRSFLTRTPARYDLLQISLIDSWAATSAGAFALSENHLYTREAFRLYLDRLAPDGVLSISRWSGGTRYLEAVRLVLLARAALVDAGMAEADRHLMVVRSGWVTNVLVSRRPFDDAELARAKNIARDRRFVLQWPAAGGTSPVARALTEGPGFLTNRGVELSAPTDNRPFFFQNVRMFGKVDPKLAATASTNEHAVLLLRWLTLLIAGVTLGLFFAPFLLARWRRQPGFWRGSSYFAAIGLGFMLVEAGWIQRFILFLGHPSYATTVVIAALLLGAGSGSVAAARVALDRAVKWAWLPPLVLFGLNALLGPLLEAALGWHVAARVLVAVALLVPPGFLMGFAFPAGMLRFGDENKPWFWAVNGATSVLASVGSLGLAMTVGFERVVLAGVLCYLAAAVLLRPGRGAPSASVESADQQ
jgi:hypothetical protein